MIISIASGKGGTGKTTVATNLAYTLNKDVQILDCDVEEPNVHLFLTPEIDASTPVLSVVPAVDENLCSLCGACSEICNFSAINKVGDTVLVFPELCHSCRGCFLVCPEQAIHESTREIGTLETGSKNGIEFVHGKLRVGEAMSPPLIKRVRKETNPDKVTIIDAPPGTSCPVMTAMKDTDFVLMVTEPTPFGLHDLKLAVDAVNTLGIPKGLVINRSDIGDDGVKKFAEERNIPILMEIPFDRSIAEKYSKGVLLVEDSQEWREGFMALYDKITSLVEE